MNPRHQNKKRKKYLEPATALLIKQVLFGVAIFSFISMFLAVVWYGTRIDTFTLSTINASGGVTIDAAVVRGAVERELEGAYLGLIPKRFAYFYPAEKILASVAQVERIKNVAIERTSGTEISVTYDEYIPDTLWCSVKEKDSCLFFDEKGYSFDKAPVLRGESVVRYYTLEQDTELKVQPFLPIDYESTKDFTLLLRDIGWFVTKIEINSARDAFYTLAGGGELRTSLAESVFPFENLQAILRSDEFSHIKPGAFQYIDLRFGSRVFVNEELPQLELATSTATTAEEMTEVDEVVELVEADEIAETLE